MTLCLYDKRKGANLYIMKISTDLDGLHFGFKIGRSFNAAKRARMLGTSMPFHMVLCAEFSGKGHFEKHLHKQLAKYRNNDGRGREWFRLTLTDALQAIDDCIYSESGYSLRARHCKSSLVTTELLSLQ